MIHLGLNDVIKVTFDAANVGSESSDQFFRVIKAVVGLRVSRETELRGLDIDEHGHEAYAGFQMNVTD